MIVLLVSLVLSTTTKIPLLERFHESDSEDEVAGDVCPQRCQSSFSRRENQIQLYQFKESD